MQWINSRLAIGDVDDSVRLDRTVEHGISGILSLTGFPDHTINSFGVDWREVRMLDGVGNSLQRLTAAVGTLDELLREHTVMVHCMEGISRSPFVVACYLAWKWGCTVERGVEFVRQRRTGTDVQPGLFDLWREYERFLATWGSAGGPPASAFRQGIDSLPDSAGLQLFT